jgi:hypothetical protein
MAVKYQIVFWRDIPAQVKIRDGRKRHGRPLSDRFEKAIDQAAMYAGLTNSDDYLGEWRTDAWQEREGDPEAIAEELAIQLEEAYPPQRLRQMARNGGRE